MYLQIQTPVIRDPLSCDEQRLGGIVLCSLDQEELTSGEAHLPSNNAGCKGFADCPPGINLLGDGKTPPRFPSFVLISPMQTVTSA
eukprot:COSAG02_NODE_1152_length_14201_cov_9.055595_9_plen_86_part_00